MLIWVVLIRRDCVYCDILEWKFCKQTSYWSKTSFFSQLKIITNFHPKISYEKDMNKSYLDFLGVAGVPGGVTPLPLALLSPITLTSSLTDTPINSGGISLLTEAAAAEAAEATFDLVGLCEPGLFMASPLNHFYRGHKKKRIWIYFLDKLRNKALTKYEGPSCVWTAPKNGVGFF